MFGRNHDVDDEQALPDIIEYTDVRSTQTVKLKIIKKFDEGGFSTVTLGKDDNGITYAIKFGKVTTTERKYLSLCNEYFGYGLIIVNDRRLLFHVLKLRGDQNLMQMIRQQIVSNQKISLEFAIKIIESCVREVMQLHEDGYSHNDIQAKNITLDADGNVHLVDFGTISKLHSDNKDFRYIKNNICTLVVGIADTNDPKALLELMCDMVDSRCAKVTLEGVVRLTKELQTDIIAPKASRHPGSFALVFKPHQNAPARKLLSQMKKVSNDHQRYLLAKKFVESNPNHPFSKVLINEIKSQGKRTLTLK
ncbi:MAG TPA: hypothetical protein VL360_08075 [Gammaproteobacteria bacterium]|jgi:hypothetical protein|nr:hypothetical protein [Gammaproteobacteria bacterium]